MIPEIFKYFSTRITYNTIFNRNHILFSARTQSETESAKIDSDAIRACLPVDRSTRRIYVSICMSCLGVWTDGQTARDESGAMGGA